jgi:SAM-dependent methyltransferase
VFLDFGCGTGEFAPCFPASHYVGIDIAAAYIRFAAHTYAGRFLVSSGDALALPDQGFDAALVLGVLHHLPDTLVADAMRELHRVLRPGAVALVMEDVPPPDAWNVAGHAMHWLDRGGYIRSEAHYRALFGAGFAVQRTYHMRSGICDYGVYVLRRLA